MVKNPGAYLQKMVSTVELVDSEAGVKRGGKAKMKEYAKKSDLIAVDIDTLRRQIFEKSLSEFHDLINEKEEALRGVLGKLRQGMFGSYFKDQLSLAQNLANPAISAILVDIARGLYPEHFTTDIGMEEKIRELEKINN